MNYNSIKTELSDELISRQAVYDLMRSLTRWCVRSEDGKFNNVGLLYDDVMSGIYKLPSVNPQEPKAGHWIPVSERLPEKYIEVLATTESGYVTIAERLEYDHWFIHEGSSNAHTDELTAWMPLPEPYKAESEDKE